MAKSLDELLGYRTLTGLIQATVPGVPDVLPAAFDSFTKQVLMDDGEYTVNYGNRANARRVRFGADARKRGLNKVGIEQVQLLHWKEEIEFEAKVMMKLRSLDSYEQDKNYEQVTAQVAFFNEYFTNLRKTIKFKTLHNPTLYFDSDGELLPDSSGADTTQTVTLYTRSASNTGQGLRMDGSTAIIGSTWATATNDIPAQIRALKKTALARTGYPIKYVMYGENILSYLIANNYVKDYLAREGKQRSEYLNDDEIGHLFGLDWIAGYDQFFYSGADQSTCSFILGADEIVAFPEPNRGWWERLDGSHPVPTNINIQTDIETAFKSMHLEHGKFAYSRVDLNKLSAVLTCGDTFFYALKVPDATYVLDVTP